MIVPANISNLCKDPVEQLKKYKDLGVNVVGYTCSYVPEELIISAGLQPYRIPNLGSKTSPLVPTFVCQFASTVLENIFRLKDFISGFVFAHTCDPMWRLYDVVKKKVEKPVFILRVPHNTEGENSLNFFKMELLRFRDFLVNNFCVKIDDQDLLEAIKVCNENRRLLKEVYMQNDNGKYCNKASNRFCLVLASMWMSKKEINSQIKASELKSDVIKESKVRLHINGTSIYELNLIRMIEDAGCFIASDDLCTGSRYFWDNVEESEDPMLALAHRYLQKSPCPSHGPLQKRLEYVDLMVQKFKVHGVLTVAQRSCDPMLYDAVHVRDMFAKKNVPAILLDYENLDQEAGRIKTRIEAFIESLSG
ncbi:MAG: 2-hydroxyacyl-CoA dehydratase family protein [Candidatus Bathyarchaeia archaeon]